MKRSKLCKKHLAAACCRYNFIWALWNYEITLSLLGSALGILMPLITGCVIAFTVNVFIEKFEQIWMRVLKDRAARFRGPVCLIAGFMLILA